MVIPDFNLARIPQTIFGPGSVKKLPALISAVAKKVLIITGGSSFNKSGRQDELIKGFNQLSVQTTVVNINKEPSPQLIDDICNRYKSVKADMVLAIGGGSVIDAGKAVSAMLKKEDSVLNYLEGVGNKVHDGQRIPFYAVPTTAGTGSEATKNAVLSDIGVEGFKRSLRHDNFIADLALIDPELALSCPHEITAACGMDAFTQLLESYLSPKSSPVTDNLALSGLSFLKDNLLAACTYGADNIHVRAAMAYASYISGITLANAGLGIVHGLASPVGGFFKIPHGVVCGTLIAQATNKNIQVLMEQGNKNHWAMQKYAHVGKLISNSIIEDAMVNCNLLIQTIETWIDKLQLPKLGKYGIREADISRIVTNTGLKENPVQLTASQITEIIIKRI
jgi:alcohol dehydrogenase class IV